eukprot:4462782-Amphidinium_carterae.3
MKNALAKNGGEKKGSHKAFRMETSSLASLSACSLPVENLLGVERLSLLKWLLAALAFNMRES